MNIIIAGAGKVGFHLAKTLLIGHNVIVVDKNIKALNRIQESLDILALQGDVEDYSTYTKIIDKDIDLFIAVTNLDNVNLVSTLIAESVLNIKRKFIRLHNHFYHDKVLVDKLSIEKIIFPRKLTSKTIISLLEYPKANNVKTFTYTQHKLISIRAFDSIESFSTDANNLKVVGIERDKNFFIPTTQDIEIKANDLIYFFALDEDIKTICSKLQPDYKTEIKKCVVFGGEDLGISISKALVDSGREVKLIEKNFGFCEKADAILQGRVEVINLKYSTTDLYDDENLADADMFISATDDDEYNIVKCLEAKERGIKKIIAINNEVEYYNLMHSLGIIVTRGPKISTYNTIMEHISTTGVVIQKSFCGANAKVYMRKIFQNSTLIDKRLKPIKTMQDTLVFYMQDMQLKVFDDKTTLKEDDLIIAFCLQKDASKVQKWIYEL
ncbi:MAG: NAD-binding protein [Campylobacterales bacterium]